jgi:hypothetical protein
VSTKIGIIAEGPIDRALLPALLERIAGVRANYGWPVTADDVAEVLYIRKRGHGGVLEAVRKLVSVLDTEYFPHAFFVILLDRRTRPVQAKIRKLLARRDRFVLAEAIEEIEAWWLADRRNVLAWADMSRRGLPVDSRYAARGYRAERDDQPKKTLDELTRISNRFDRYYGNGNTDMATEFAEEYWRRSADLGAIRAQCPKGYATFEAAAVNHFRAAKGAAGRLF